MESTEIPLLPVTSILVAKVQPFFIHLLPRSLWVVCSHVFGIGFSGSGNKIILQPQPCVHYVLLFRKPLLTLFDPYVILTYETDETQKVVSFSVVQNLLTGHRELRNVTLSSFVPRHPAVQGATCLSPGLSSFTF